MMRFVQLSLLPFMATGLLACGGAKLGGGKEGAAQAVFHASQPTGRGGMSQQRLLQPQALARGTSTLGFTVPCSHHGTATLTLDTTQLGGGTDPNGLLAYDVLYKECNEDGENELDGALRTTLSLELDTGDGTAIGKLLLGMVGRLDIDGEITDFVDANIRMGMDFAATSVHTGTVNLVLDGTITTSEATYVYTQETLAIPAGQLPPAQ